MGERKQLVNGRISGQGDTRRDAYRLPLKAWLPTTKKEVEQRGWDELDVILFSGDAYVDHPSFGAAVIGRTLEAQGLRVAIVPQPDWHGDYRDFKKLGRPRMFFGIAPGCMDSMVNKYTANRRLRSEADPTSLYRTNAGSVWNPTDTGTGIPLWADWSQTGG